DEVLGAESFFDVREVVVGGLEEIRALASSLHGFAVAGCIERTGSRARRALTGALERVELVVSDTGGFVGERHYRAVRCRCTSSMRGKLPPATTGAERPARCVAAGTPRERIIQPGTRRPPSRTTPVPSTSRCVADREGSPQWHQAAPRPHRRRSP